MVLNKIREVFAGNNDKYEALYYKYSQVKLENSKLKDNHRKEKLEHKENIQRNMAQFLIKLYQNVETVKRDSFKIHKVDKDLQNLLIGINQIEKIVKEEMKNFSVEEMSTNERFYDPEIHEIASYEPNNGMAKGLVLKTVKKGFKYKNEIIEKPRVTVTK